MATNFRPVDEVEWICSRDFHELDDDEYRVKTYGFARAGVIKIEYDCGVIVEIPVEGFGVALDRQTCIRVISSFVQPQYVCGRMYIRYHCLVRPNAKVPFDTAKGWTEQYGHYSHPEEFTGTLNFDDDSNVCGAKIESPVVCQIGNTLVGEKENAVNQFLIDP